MSDVYWCVDSDSEEEVSVFWENMYTRSFIGAKAAGILEKTSYVSTNLYRKYYKKRYENVEISDWSMDDWYEGLHQHEDDCLAEVERMKEHRLNASMSLHDVLTTDDSRYTQDPELLKILEPICKRYKSEYRKLGSLLEWKLKEDLKKELLEPSIEALACLISAGRTSQKTTLPDLPLKCRKKIVNHLDGFSLKNLIEIVSSLKI